MDVIRLKKLGWIFFFACLAAIPLIPLRSNTALPAILDYINHISGIMQAKEAISQGQFPLRIAPTEHNGWAYPLFQFYSPTSYFIAGCIYKWLTPANPYVAFKVTLWLAYLLGGFYMFRLSSDLLQSKQAAIVASVVYVTSPYVVITINHLGAFNEAIALGMLPAVIYYFLKFYDQPSKKTFIQATLAWYFLITIHLITFFCSVAFLTLFLFILSCQTNSKWKNLIGSIGVIVYSSMLAMYFLAPIATISKYLIANHTFNDAETFHHLSPMLTSLLAPIANTKLASVTLLNQVHPAIGLPIFFAVCMSCYLVTRKIRSQNTVEMDYLRALLFLFFITFFIAWSPINLWAWLPKPFLVLQYSWRLLGQMIWIGALLMAFVMDWAFANKLDVGRIVLYTLLCITATMTWIIAPMDRANNMEELLQTRQSGDFYLMDGLQNQKFIHMVSNLLLDANTFHDRMMSEEPMPVSLSKIMLKSAVAPALEVHGQIGAMSFKTNELQIFGNGVALADFYLQPGDFDWRIPLDQLHDKQLNSDLNLQFKINSHDIKPSDLNISIEKVTINGFLNADLVTDVESIRHNCLQDKENTICQMQVGKNIRLLELPTFYYPNFLHVTDNGKTVPYYSVLYDNHLITAIIPESGKWNNIHIQFRGLLWANFMSTMAWLVLLIPFVFYCTQKKFHQSDEALSRLK